MFSRALGAFVTSPAAFLLSGVLDVALALRLAATYLWRTTILRRWASGKGS